MADTKTTASVLDDSQIALMDGAFFLEAQDKILMDNFVDVERQIGAKSIDFVKYAKLAYATTPLVDGTDLDAVGMSDSKVTMTPKEYGNVVTTTRLASLQSGGKADLGASQLVARNMAESMNRIAMTKAQGSSNTIDGSAGNITAGVMENLYFKLSSNNVERFDGDAYVAVVHPAVASDLAKLSDWQDVQKYADAVQILKNEVGFYKGFRFFASSGLPVDDSGSADEYECLFFGRNAIGKAVSEQPSLRITDGNDKLGRFLNIGWYGVVEYGIVDSDAIWTSNVQSSFS